MFTRHYKVWPKDLPKTMTLPKTSLYTNLEVSALRYPDHDAIVFYDAPMTYARLKREVDTMAGYLQAQGVKKGDRVRHKENGTEMEVVEVNKTGVRCKGYIGILVPTCLEKLS